MKVKNKSRYLGKISFIGITIGFAVVFGLIILLIPGYREGRKAAYRMGCTSYLHGLCVAVQDYQYYQCCNKYRVYNEKLPFFGDRSTGEEYWSWRAVWIARDDHYGDPRFILSEPWNSEHNLSLFKKTDVARNFSCPGDQRTDKASYVAVTGPGTVWTEMQNGNLPGEFYDYEEMILIIETSEPKNFWAQPGDDVTPEEVIRLFEADPGLVKNSNQKTSYSHWPKNYVNAIGEAKNFDFIKSVKELQDRLTVSSEQIEKVRKKVEEREILLLHRLMEKNSTE